jgi:hypothetical protein
MNFLGLKRILVGLTCSYHCGDWNVALSLEHVAER